MPPSSTLLLKNGTVVVHDANDHAAGIKADVLVRGNRIAEIGPDIAVMDGVEVIDCQDKIVAPGFVDTHRHMYNTGLRGRYADSVLTDYIVTGILQSSNFEPNDVFWGQLAGSMECLDIGTTTVVDHSHVNYSDETPKAAIAGSIVSGLRTVYGYCFNARVESWSPFTFHPDFIPPWGLDSLEELSRRAPFGDGRVTLAVAFDGWFLPEEVVVPMFKRIRGMGIKQITIHMAPPPPGRPSSVEVMESYGLLASNVILSHANMLTPKEIALVKRRNAHISVSPSVELQMAMGTPACFDSERDVHSQCSIGLDCHNTTVPSIPAELRCALQASRGVENAKFVAAGKKPAKMYQTVQEAYKLGTIQAARGVGMGDQIGSLAVGKLADIIVFDALSSCMICAAQHDPVAAIVMHSTPGDIVATIVDGVVRKRDGKLESVSVPTEARPYTGPDVSSLQWSDIAQALLRSRETLQSKWEKTNFQEAKPIALKAYGFEESLRVDWGEETNGPSPTGA